MAEEIKGVELSQMLDDVELELLLGKRAEVRKVIMGIYGDLARWDREMMAKQKELASLQSKRIGALEKLEKLRRGDWTALPSAQQKQEGTQNDDKQT